MAICRKWDVLATVVGEVTDGDRLIDRLARRDGSSTSPRGPSRTKARSTSARTPGPTGRTGAGRRCRAAGPAGHRRRAGRDPARDWSRSPNLCDKSWVTDQYDRYVRGNSVLAQPEDAGMLRIDEQTDLGVALATDCNGRFCLARPVRSAPSWRWPRRTATSPSAGREPVAITDCLNFGSPEDPAVMWQFSEAIARPGRRLPRARHAGHRRQRQLLQPDRRRRRSCRRRSSGVLGVIDDVTRRTPIGFAAAGRRDLPAGRDPRRAGRLGLGATSSTVISAVARRRWTSTHEKRLAEVLVSAQPARAAEQRPRSGRRRTGPGAGRVLPAYGHRSRRSTLPDDGRPVRRAVLREHRAGAGLDQA